MILTLDFGCFLDWEGFEDLVLAPVAASVLLVSVVETTVRLMFTVVGMAPNDVIVGVVWPEDLPVCTQIKDKG